MNIIEAIKDERLFKPIFKDLFTWQNWFVLLKVFFAIPMDEAEFKTYQQYTGRSDRPKKEFKELQIVET